MHKSKIPPAYQELVASFHKKKLFRKTFPVNVAGLAKKLNIDIYLVDRKKMDGCSGMIAKHPTKAKRYAIALDNKLDGHKMMFVIAHHIAYFMLDQNGLDQGEVHGSKHLFKTRTD